LAEAAFNALAGPEWRAMSAGSHPTGTVHPRSLAILRREGISTEGLHSKSWVGLPSVPDIVITVCGNAAGETCPAYLGPVVRGHWGVDDPAKATGTEAEIDAKFEQAYRTLRARIEAYLKLPLDRLRQDREQLKVELDHIAKLS
jgi:arsenate reductase